MEKSSKTMFKRWLWSIGIIITFVFLILKLENLVTLALLSFLLSFVLNPLVTCMAKSRFIGRTAATLITMFGLSIGFLTILFVIIPEVLEEFRLFFAKLPSLLERLQVSVIPQIEKFIGVSIPRSWNEAFDQLYNQITQQGDQLVAPVAKIAGKIFDTTFLAIFAIISSLMFPLFLFFLLKDFPKIINTINNLIPLRNRPIVSSLAKDVDKSLSAFLHGQFTVMLILGTLYSVGYSIVGIPVAIGIGLLTGLLCFIPYVGAATGFLLALMLSALGMLGWQSLMGVVIVFGIVQFLDAIIITPKILGGKLGLKPLWIIVALMAGAELFGFLGVLLAVPTTAILKILVAHYIQRYKSSSLFLSKKSTTQTQNTNDK